MFLKKIKIATKLNTSINIKDLDALAKERPKVYIRIELSKIPLKSLVVSLLERL